MRELSKTEKLQVATLIIACCLVFYAVGIATDFFASPIFSMFFIVSAETAHNVVTSVAVATAIALSIVVLAMGLIKKRKTVFPETYSEPIIRTNKAPIEAPVRVAQPTINHKITNYFESDKTEQENQSAKQPIMQPTKQSTTQIPTQPNTEKIAATNQVTTIACALNKDKITCPTCTREFGTPLYMVDYSTLKPKLIRICPYCNQALDLQPKNPAQEDAFKNYVTQPQNEFVKKP
jgi:hypothetical protein